MRMVGFANAAATAANGNFEERRRGITLRPLFRRRLATSDLGGCRSVTTYCIKRNNR
jgi:hypothetical protein